ncbi:hypothetical protein JMN32_23170 [Fulvivirga sp. 29W222]|uniref:AttH domain-containing protein n=1 Tax=Fulvivirga marina TaxID=2494733 RepID=A0A937FZX2_9BACT|nr:lipocalin family protein [Fulvivirga marina]MBL6449230.1 hypothetical protein [Fulvivirga marina]
MMRKLILICLPVLVSCKFTPYSGSDVYNAEAHLPEDEALHFKNSLEWWYFTGHLDDVNSGREYGLEYVIFHFNPRNKNDYLMTNFAITVPESGKFVYDYKILKLDSLLKPELPLRLVAEDKGRLHKLEGSMGKYYIKANMKKEPVEVELSTEALKPVLLHNNTGYETYGEYTKAGYYSFPRLSAKGYLNIDGKNIEVAGELWYDRQWNCVGVWQKEVAWDWISVQFEDPSSELMLYRLHHFGDNKVLFGGSYYDEEGNAFTLQEEDMELEELGYWESSRSKAIYPVKWRLKVLSLNLDIIIEARIPDQELGVGFTTFYKLYYWEGMCSVTGELNGKPVTGKSYVELTNRDAFNKK